MSDNVLHPVNFSAVLLAGGRSRRMGQDKAFLIWQKQPLWSLQLEKLRQLKPARLLIACREEQLIPPGHAEFIFDPPGEDLGPLPAITRALTAVQQPLLVMAVDMPFMTTEFLKERLLESTICTGKSLFFKSAHGVEPLAGFYDPLILPRLQSAIADRQLSLTALIHGTLKAGLADIFKISSTEQRLFGNINTAAEWTAKRQVT